MAIKTVNLFWFGKNDKLPTGSGMNVSEANAKSVVGSAATGKDELKAVGITGNTVQNSGSKDQVFVPTYHAWDGRPATDMSYTSPSSGNVTTTQIRSFMHASFKLTIVNAAGQQEVVNQNGVIIHMKNGDMFFRPSVQSLKDWSDIKKLISMEVTSARPAIEGIADIGFNADIFDLPVVCFATGTLVRTDKGDVAVEMLSAGDLVLTKDAGFQPVKWVGGRQLDEAFLRRNPNMQPIRIRAGALGNNMPTTDLVVSPQHRILVNSGIAQRFFGAAEVLIAAKHLTAIEGISVAEDINAVGYHHFMFDQHQIVFSNGAETESFYAGKEALKALSSQARAEIYTIFPELASHDCALPPRARIFLNGKQGRQVAALCSGTDMMLAG